MNKKPVWLQALIIAVMPFIATGILLGVPALLYVLVGGWALFFFFVFVAFVIFYAIAYEDCERDRRREEREERE